MDKLPDEVLVHILGMVSAYEDSNNCASVNHRFRSCVQRAQVLRHRRYLHHAREGSLQWSRVVTSKDCEDSLRLVGQRYSHASAYDAKRDLMMVFGGCTSTSTTFNDLWTLNLSDHSWTRMVSSGSCPSPKACCTMLLHDDRMVVFGGWTHPSLYPLHQTWKLFNELHILSVEEKKWIQVLPSSSIHPPPMAGHSATMHGKNMIVFGGLQKQRQSIGRFTSSNDVWCFDLETLTWDQPAVTSDPSPSPRYGQSQLYIDPHHLLIIGGCGGPNQSFSDIWILSLLGQPFQWIQCEVLNEEHSAKHLWCHPACKIGSDLAVVLCNSSPRATSRYQWSVIPQLQRGINRGAPSIRRASSAVKEGQRSAHAAANASSLQQLKMGSRQSFDGASASKPEAGLQKRETRRTASLDHISPQESRKLLAFASNAPRTYNSRGVVSSPRSRQQEVHENQLETLKRINASLNVVAIPEGSLDHKGNIEKNQRTSEGIEVLRDQSVISTLLQISPGLDLKVLDLSEILSHSRAKWLPTNKTHVNDDSGTCTDSNMETILYTLVEGKSELIMFGGVNKDVTSSGGNGSGNSSNGGLRAKETVSNALFLLKPPSYLL